MSRALDAMLMLDEISTTQHRGLMQLTDGRIAATDGVAILVADAELVGTVPASVAAVVSVEHFVSVTMPAAVVVATHTGANLAAWAGPAQGAQNVTCRECHGSRRVECSECHQEAACTECDDGMQFIRPVPRPRQLVAYQPDGGVGFDANRVAMVTQHAEPDEVVTVALDNLHKPTMVVLRAAAWSAAVMVRVALCADEIDPGGALFARQPEAL